MTFPSKKIRRLFNCARIILWPAIFVNAFVVALYSTSASFFESILIALSLCCVASYGFLINDCKDISVDRINNSNRLENADESELRFIWSASFVLLFAALSFSCFLGTKSILLVGLTGLGLAVYTFYARQKLMLATVLAATLSSSPLWIPGIVFDSNLSFFRIGIVSIVVCLIMGREIIFDVKDYRGDMHGKRRTFATVFSRQLALKIAISLLVLGGVSLCAILFLDDRSRSNSFAWIGVALFCWLIFSPAFRLSNDPESSGQISDFIQKSRLAMLLFPIFWLIF